MNNQRHGTQNLNNPKASFINQAYRPDIPFPKYIFNEVFPINPKPFGETLRKDTGNRKAFNERQSLHQQIEALTPREYEVLTHVITGMLNKQIAYALNIGEKTEKFHHGWVMQKLGIDSVAKLVGLVEKAGIEPAQVSDP